MTKERLEQLRYIEIALKNIKRDIADLNKKINSSCSRTYVDRTKGSMSDFPYIETTFPMVGVDYSAYKKLKTQLEHKEAELQEELFKLEAWLDEIEDIQLYNIFRLRYRNGLTTEQIGKELGYDRSSVSYKINKYLKEE